MADRAEIFRRFGTLVLAGVFLLTSVGFTALIFWESRRNNDEINESNVISTDEMDQINQAQGENMLEGTKLADFTPITGAVTELQKIDLIEGTGEEVKAGATVTAHYTGAYASTGEIFQSSHDSGNPIPFGLESVIAGWTEGVPGMKVGGKRRLVIPGNLAYGEAPEGYTPGSTDRPMGPLVFDIEITEVQNP